MGWYPVDPRTRSFEGGRGPQHRGVCVPAADDLQADRQAFAVQPHGMLMAGCPVKSKRFR